MGNKRKGGAVFVSGTPKKCRTAKIRAALAGKYALARLAIPCLYHIKAIVAESPHTLFFFLAPSGMLDGDFSIFLFFPNGNGEFVCFGRIIVHRVELAFRHIFLLGIQFHAINCEAARCSARSCSLDACIFCLRAFFA